MVRIGRIDSVLSSPSRSDRLTDRLERFLPWLVVLFGSSLALRRISGFDFWWHLASGRWIANHLGVQTTDVFSFTASGQPWINLQWLFDLLLYGLHGAGGLNVVVLAKTVCFALVLWILVRQVNSYLGPLGGSILLAWVILIVQPRLGARPEVVS